MQLSAKFKLPDLSLTLICEGKGSIFSSWRNILATS